MRHVTPYSFIEHAIKSLIMTGESVKNKYIEDLVGAIKPLISGKKGICLNPTEYDKLLSIIDIGSKEFQHIEFKTRTQDVKNKHHLIYNEELIKEFYSRPDFQQIQNTAEKKFQEKFKKYIEGGMKYLTDEILDPNDPNTVTIVCEGIARIILTLFNQDKYAAFPEEGNSLLEEIRVYKNRESAQDAKKGNKKIHEQMRDKIFNVMSHSEVVKEIQANSPGNYDLRIRIVNNEGIQTRNASDALKMLNFLVTTQVSGHTDIDTNTYDEYNNKYNFKIKVSNLSDDYNKDLNQSNLKQIFYYHVAKYLYLVFDFKPLEPQVLAPKQGKEEEKIVKVYPSATGMKDAEYSVRTGDEYRKLQYNARKGYNDNAVFRSEIDSEKNETILKKIIIRHVMIALIPYDALRFGFAKNDTSEGMKKVLNSFLELIKCDYKEMSSIPLSSLDDVWIKRASQDLHDSICDTSSMSEPTQDNFIDL